MIQKYELSHHKDFHKIQLQGLKLKERNIFMALALLAMDQDTNILEFDILELAKLSNYTQTKAGENIYKYLRDTYKAIKNITIQIDKTNGFKDFVLFTLMETFEDRGIVQIQINENYRYLLNEIAKPYTIQNLFEYNKLSSKYSQLTYSLLKEWEGVKNVTLPIDDFKQKLGIDNFLMHNIDKRVLTPVMEELPKYFRNLKYEKIKSGRKIAYIKFSWEKNIKKLEASQKDKSLDKAKNIEILLEKEFENYCNKYFDNTKLKRVYDIKFAKALYTKYRDNPKIIPSEKQNIDVFSFLFDFDKSENKS